MFKVPTKTSVFKNHTHSPVGIISFAPELIKFIKEKKKYQTYRFADEKYQQIKIGDIVSTTFINLPLNSPGHETAKNKDHQRKVLSGYYAFLGRPIRDDDPFLIVDFELIS